MRDFINIILENLSINEDIETEMVDGPEAWASYLVNGDDSGLDAEEVQLADKWLQSLAPYEVVSVEGEPHFSKNFHEFDPRFTSGSVVQYVLQKR